MEDFFALETYRIEDIESLIHNHVEESIHLDYKSAAALSKTDGVKKEISKDVAAFANSDGGIIIYGVVEENHIPVRIDFVDGNRYSKEWLEHVINSTIEKRIQEIEIFPIRQAEDITQSLYLVRIPRSSNVPHMSRDKRFYRRFNFESIMMAEYEVRDLYNRSSTTSCEIVEPQIEGSSSMRSGGGKLISYRIKIEFKVTNTGNSIEELYKVEIRLPRRIVVSNNRLTTDIGRYRNREEGEVAVFTIGSESPLFQGETLSIATAELEVKGGSFGFLENYSSITLLYSSGRDDFEFRIVDYIEYEGVKLSRSHFIG